MTVENFVRIVWTILEKIEKSRKMAVFGLILAIYKKRLIFHLLSHQYDQQFEQKVRKQA